jgi:hypothetical protein
MPDRLRFAVLCSGASLTRSSMRMIERLVEREDALCVAVLEMGQEPPLPGGKAWSPYRAWHSRQPRFSIYERYPDLPKLECLPGAPDMARIAALNLDFCLQASPSPLTGDLAGVARFGVWTLFYGQDGDPYGVVPPVFAELERGDPHIPVSLERLGEGLSTPRSILRRGVVNAVPRSYAETLENAVMAGYDFPALVARQLLKHGTLPVLGTHTPAAKPPSAAQVAGFFIKLGSAGVRDQWLGTLYSEMWNVGVVNQPIAAFLDSRYPSQIDWLPSPGPRQFLADPFAVEAPEGFQLLTEAFDYDRYQGYITSAIYRPGSPLSDNRTVIDEQVHMSYPFPLTYKGQRYCIPECQTRREVSIYRVEEGRWVKAATLIRDFAAVDATVIEYNGRWWLFCNCQEDLRDSKLFIWHAADLFGPWEPHALNPVKCDVRCSRPGGTPFLHNGELYRPAQDSSTSYGCALSINHVVRLTVDEFEEETVAHIEPPAGVNYRDGLHTLSAAGTMTVLDGKRMTLIPALAIRRFLHKLKRLARLAK